VRLALAALILGASIVGDQAGAPAAAADPANGEAAARDWCAECHLVSADQPDVRPVNAPSFASIAARRDAAFLHAFLAEQHLPMPTFRLMEDEKVDLVAYIESLRSAADE
jgi:mono/diheme cytochrome c family protein